MSLSLVGKAALLAVPLALGVAAWATSRPPQIAPAAPPPSSAPGASRALLRVPRAPAPIVINAETEGKPVWQGDRGGTQDFRDPNGKGLVPYTEARLRWDAEKLYLLLYAGDLDLEGSVAEADGPVEKDDAFRMEFGDGAHVRVVSVSVLGTIADAICSGAPDRRRCDPAWSSHAAVAVDRDGTLNRTGDNDEEWVVEMAVPFSDLGIDRPSPGTRISFSIKRCEVGHGAQPCGGWGLGPLSGELVLDP